MRHRQDVVSSKDYQKFRSKGRIYWVMSWNNECQIGQSDVLFIVLPGAKGLELLKLQMGKKKSTGEGRVCVFPAEGT